jgi:hypothetical protein
VKGFKLEAVVWREKKKKETRKKYEKKERKGWSLVFEEKRG